MVKNEAMFFILAITLLVLFFVQVPFPAAASPEIVGEAAVLIDATNGQVLFEKNPHRKMFPASTTKILTAIIALEKGRMSDIVTIPEEACSIEGSAIGLQEGERISLEDLLYSLMLSSGNDAAVAIACHIGGSVKGFARMMNDKASDIGAMNSHFNNPNGLPDPGHYTTAYDMALISRYAMQNQKFREIVSTKIEIIERVVPGAQTYLQNHNKLLWQYDGATGIKTGYTVDAGQCLAASASRQGRELIAVVMNSKGANIWTDTKKILDYGFEEFIPVTLTKAGRVVADAPVRFGKSNAVPVQTSRSLSYNFPRDMQDDIKHKILLQKNITAPVLPGEKLGELVFLSGDREVGRVDLLAQQEVKRSMLAQWWLWLLMASLGLLLDQYVKRSNVARRERWEKYKLKYKYYK